MKRILIAAGLTFAVFFGPPLRAASPVAATLTLPNDAVLPGVPFDIVVTYTNVSDHQVTIGGALAFLVVTSPDGNTTVIDHPETGDHWDISGSMPLRLAPGGSAQEAAGWDNGSIPNWFHYSFYSGPGTYEIALDLRIRNHRGEPVATIRTPAVKLTRIEPIGIDAELWKRMQAISGGAWADDSFVATGAGNALGAEILEVHPDSDYYPYLLALRSFGRGVEKCQIPGLLEAAERFPKSPAYPYLLSAMANCARYAGETAEYAGNMAEAKTHYAFAQNKYREVLATKNVAIRKLAERNLRHIQWQLDRAAKKPLPGE